MKILITNHHLEDFAGTENSTFKLAKHLKDLGNEVFIYTKYLSPKFSKIFKKHSIPVVEHLGTYKDKKFDIAHVHHNICAYEVRYMFPKLPIIMKIHGVIPFLELPPIIDLNISKFLVNNQEGFDFIKNKNIDKSKIIIWRNMIDKNIFFPTSTIRIKPKTALVISNKMTLEKEKILIESLKYLKIKSKFIGKNYGTIPNEKLPKYINKSDIVFTLAVGAIETMFCGRIPILFDYNSSPFDDGIVTNKNFEKLMEYNFSGRATKQIFSKLDLINEIKKYNYKEGEKLRQKAIKYYDSNKQTKKIIKIYHQTIENFKYKKINSKNKEILKHIVLMIEETKFHSIQNTKLINKYQLPKI